jgi:hypothetical protein
VIQYHVNQDQNLLASANTLFVRDHYEKADSKKGHLRVGVGMAKGNELLEKLLNEKTIDIKGNHAKFEIIKKTKEDITKCSKKHNHNKGIVINEEPRFKKK